MSEDGAHRVRALFDRLVDLDPVCRARILDAECAAVPEIRREVEGLLARAGQTGELPVLPVIERLRPLEQMTAIGPYRISGLLGEGGFGEVYVAEQTEPLRRRVALKILKAGMDSRAVLSRFETERQALALMDHPNIAHVFDAGETPRGRPYFVMELILGSPITVHARERKLALRERLELFVPVCRAVHHAHQKGIIHRDIKPSNILVTEEAGQAVPKVIDFGIAKAASPQGSGLDTATRTKAGEIIGTPAYMSPEQAASGGVDIDTRTDVYSLGIVLYELLTGTVPLDDGVDPQSPARIPKPSARVRAREAAAGERPAGARSEARALARLLRGDLDWIVLKATDPDRRRRYESALDLALDIERSLRNEAVLAGPPSMAYRARKFLRRHRQAMTAATLLLAITLAGAIESHRQRVQAERARKESEAVTGFLSAMLEAVDPRVGRQEVTVREILDAKARTLAEELPGQPLARARLMVTIGNVYQALGRYDESRGLLEGALALRQRELGPEHRLVAYCHNNLGILLRSMGDLPAALAHYERALEIYNKRQGPESPNAATCLNNIGNVFMELGDLRAARSFYERSLAIREKARAPGHPDIAQSLHNLAGLLEELEEYAQAESLYTRALSMREKTFGSHHPDVAQTRFAYARLLGREGRGKESIPILESVLAIQEQTLGPEHVEVAATLRCLGTQLSKVQEMGRALHCLERAVQIEERGFGPNHPELGNGLADLAAYHMEAGALDRAEEIYRRASRILEASRGSEHYELVLALDGLADVYERKGDFARALVLRERVVVGMINFYGDGHSRTNGAREKLARTSRVLGRAAG